jgi:hypothetical protein
VDSEVLYHFTALIETTSNTSIKATCFYCLSLIASSLMGVQLLEDVAWESVMINESNVVSFPGIALPSNSRLFCQVSKRKSSFYSI